MTDLRVDLRIFRVGEQHGTFHSLPTWPRSKEKDVLLGHRMSCLYSDQKSTVASHQSD